MALIDVFVALAIGVAFGFALERAGLGSARKLSGQFLLTDLTVFKVMFSAILTAMLGIFWLGRFGVLDVSFLYVPDTFLPAQAAGGLIFGAGFALAGLCPGTSCVSAATGRGDGAMVVAGMFGGVLATGLAFPLVEPLYNSGPRGAQTLPQLLHAPEGLVVFGVVLVALAGFAAAEAIEARAVSWPRIPLPQPIVWAGIVVLVLGGAAAVARTPSPRKAAPSAAAVPDKPRARPANGC